MSALDNAARRSFRATMDEASALAADALAANDLSVDEAIAIVQQLEELAGYAALAIERFDEADHVERVEQVEPEPSPDLEDDGPPLAAAEGVPP